MLPTLLLLLPLLAATAVGCGPASPARGDGGTDADAEAEGDGGVDGGADGDVAADADGEVDLVWPNAESAASSDPWIVEHHDEIRQMRPRVLALNFVNARSMEQMHDQLQQVVDVVAEASRYHGYADPEAPPFLVYDLAYEVDLRDGAPPEGWPYRNSTLYPREDPQEGAWSFDYERLFDRGFADLYGIEDPESPGRNLDLCELFGRGLVHEVWIYGDADVPDVSAAEILEQKPFYDAEGRRLDRPMNRCAGNGCFDAEDEIPAACTGTVRIAWLNNARGPGCFLESLSHGFESIAAWNADQLPSLRRDFVRFAGYALDVRYDAPFDSFYACPYGEPCLSYPSETSVAYDTGEHAGVLDPFDPGCGNVHFPPNGRQHYDLASPATVRCTCETFGLGSAGEGELRPFTAASFEGYRALAPDCMGPFLVYWRQSFPGLDTSARDPEGRAIRNFWPYVYY